MKYYQNLIWWLQLSYENKYKNKKNNVVFDIVFARLLLLSQKSLELNFPNS